MTRHPIPPAALAHHIAILGKTGSGKTVAAKGMVEILLDQRERVCIINPTGVWWGLRLAADGKSRGFEIAIFGGAHGDVPLPADHGEAIAEIIATSSTSAIIDTSQMRVGERTRFFAAFAEAIRRSNRGPLHLVIDECHLFMPQGRVADPASGQMLHAANNMVSLGRAAGLRITLLSQRPAKVHKDSLSQVETLVAMRLVAPQDRNAVEAWIADNDDRTRADTVIQSLPSLKRGEGWIWAPELGMLELQQFPMCASFDSSNPEQLQGSKPELVPIDLAQISQRLATMVEEAKAADPKTLKSEIQRLKQQLQAKGPNANEIAAAEERGWSRGWAEARGQMERFIEAHQRAAIEVKAVFGALDLSLRKLIMPGGRPTATGPSAGQAPSPDRPPQAHLAAPSHKLGPERRPLSVLAAASPAGMTEAQWAVAAGLKRSGGTWGTYIGRLKAAGLIRWDQNLFFATPEGVAATGGAVLPAPPPGPALVDFWVPKISGGGRLLKMLAVAYPGSLTRDDLAAQAGLSAAGGTFGTYLSRLRSAGLIEVEGAEIRVSPSLMEPPS